MLVYLAAAEAPRDCALPVQQSDDATHLQREHVAGIKEGGKHRSSFGSYNTFSREIFHDLGLESDRKVNNLPYKSLGSLFKGRDDFLKQIHEQLGSIQYHGFERTSTITASATAVAVHGLGGSGKTRVAIEYAHRYGDEHTALLFVRADTPGGLQQNMAALCGEAVLDLPEKDAREIDVQVAAVLQWLQQHAGWLLIFDSADAEEAAQAVIDLLGKLTDSGQVLVTSRLSNWPGAVKALSLDELSDTAAAEFLLERTGRRRMTNDDPAQALWRRTLSPCLGKRMQLRLVSRPPISLRN